MEQFLVSERKSLFVTFITNKIGGIKAIANNAITIIFLFIFVLILNSLFLVLVIQINE
jgi:hypothetical protein